MKVLLNTLLVLTFLALVIFGWQYFATNRPSGLTPVLTLGNIPGQDCPKNAQLVITDIRKKVVTDRTVVIDSCQNISFSDLSNKRGSFTVYLKVPGALAFKEVVTLPLAGSLSHDLAFGDINNDNVIDSLDESQVLDGLFKNSAPLPAADINKDGVVTALDLAYVRLNKGVGVARPDGKSWL